MENGKIKVKVVSERGHDTFMLEPIEAVERAKMESEKGKWIYLDGNFKSFDTLSKEDISNASEIVLVNALQGG